jgi:hypothetical protein
MHFGEPHAAARFCQEKDVPTSLQRHQLGLGRPKPHGAVALEIPSKEPNAGGLARAIMIGLGDLTERLGRSRELHEHEHAQLALTRLCGIREFQARENCRV